jgi:hypothetical protein
MTLQRVISLRSPFIDVPVVSEHNADAVCWLPNAMIYYYYSLNL